jgi:tetratricopeptide (TPR) repeat protein
MTVNIEALKEKARRHEQEEEWRKALDLYLRAIQRLEQEDRPDIGLHNRVGDLFTRVGKAAEAVEHYETAVDLYDEADLPNNAIAVCKKIIRNVPGRHEVFLRMGQIRARQGFVVDARDHFLTYAERVRVAGDVDEALRALVEFADLVPDDAEIRLALAAQYEVREHVDEAVEQLGLAYAQLRAAGDESQAEEVAARLRVLDEDVDLDAFVARSRVVPEEPALLSFESTSLGSLDEGVDTLAGLDDDFEIALTGDEQAQDEPEAESGAAVVPADDDAPLPFDAFDDEPDFEDAASDDEVEALPFLEGTENLSPPVEPSAPAPSAPELDAADAWTSPDTDEATAEPDADAGWPVEVVEDRAVDGDGSEAAAVDEVEDHVEDDIEDEVEDEDEVGAAQRTVEQAFRSGDEPALVGAYLGLAGALERSGADDRARSVYQQVLALDPGRAEALEGLGRLGAEAPPAPEVASSEDYVDLGALILGDDAEKTTRFVVAYEEPSGDENADFARMLSQFKAKVAANVDASDVRAHHDLGMAYREMGLLDEAIEQFQKALRASADHLATYEALGQAFLEKDAPAAAVRVLTRALDAPWEVEEDLLGIYYYLGRGYEAQGKAEQAVEYYDRVFSLDINFADVTERLRVLR